MALNLKASADIVFSVPLACDPALVLANLPHCGAETPCADLDKCEHLVSHLARYILTGDADGLIIPPDCSHAMVHALSTEEVRQAESDGATGMRYRERDRATYERAQAEAERRRKGKDPDALAHVLDDLSDDDLAAYHRFEEWDRRRNKEVARRGLISLSDAPEWERGPQGYPVESVLLAPTGEAIIRQVAMQIMNATLLGKAPPRSSGCSSGVSDAASASATSAPPAMPATDGCGAGTAPSCAAAS